MAASGLMKENHSTNLQSEKHKKRVGSAKSKERSISEGRQKITNSIQIPIKRIAKKNPSKIYEAEVKKDKAFMMSSGGMLASSYGLIEKKGESELPSRKNSKGKIKRVDMPMSEEDYSSKFKTPGQLTLEGGTTEFMSTCLQFKDEDVFIKSAHNDYHGDPKQMKTNTTDYSAIPIETTETIDIMQS